MVRAVGEVRRIQLHLPLALLALLLARPEHDTNVAGSAVVLLGLALRTWAAGVLVKGGGLCTDGPYRFVRHPLYVGSALAAAGFAVMMHTPWGWMVVLPPFLALYAWQVWLEERALRERYGEAHARWARQVPMLLPWPGRVGRGEGRRWHLSQAAANREHYHAAVTLGLVALFYLRTVWLTIGQS